MKYRRLGKTELRVSVIGVGTWQFGGEWGRTYRQDEVDAILDKAAELGINFIDTAECYGDHLSERLIGDYLSRRRSIPWIVGTKFGHQYHGFMNRSWHLTPHEVLQQLEDSLKALRIETIDLYQFHSGSDEDFQNPALWEMLQKQRQAGKIRHLGISIASKLGRFQAERATEVGAEALQVVYNRLERKAEQEFFPQARAQDLGILARVPLASGLLSGKYAPGSSPFSENDVRSTFDADRTRKYLEEVELIRNNEVPEGVSMAQWALAWCLKDPIVSAVIPGCKDVAQLEINAGSVKRET